jgi:glycosyltransferase involved in cell wall biosynthesis
MKKSILIATAVFPPEPVVSARISREIADKLMASHEVVVLCPRPSRPAGFNFEGKSSDFKGKVVYMDSYICAESSVIRRFKESISFGRHLADFIKQNSNNISCVYANVWPLFAQWIVVKTCRMLNIPCVLQIMDVYPESLTEKLRFPLANIIKAIFLPVDKQIIRHASKVIVISDRMKNYLTESRKMCQDKMVVVRNWQDFRNADTSEMEVNQDEFLVMYAGSISPTANLPFIINAFLKLNQENVKLMIAGDGSDKAICEKIVRESANNQINFCTFNPDEVFALQARANLLILSLQKGISKTATPSKLTSYLFSEKPVLACVEKDSDVADILLGAGCGFIAEPDNEVDLLKKLKEIVALPAEVLTEMGKRAGKYAVNHFSAEINLKKVTEIIEKEMHEQ